MYNVVLINELTGESTILATLERDEVETYVTDHLVTRSDPGKWVHVFHTAWWNTTTMQKIVMTKSDD